MELKDILKKVGAIIENSHIVYTSGKHGSLYINKDALYPHIQETSAVAKMMAEKYKDEEIDVVVGPALGGIILSQWVAHHLSVLQKKEIFSVYAEKDAQKNLIFTRGYDQIVKGRKILVVEDITNTGGSTKKVIDAVQHVGGTVVAACVMVNRSPDTVTSEMMGAPFSALSIIEAETYEANECPLCKENIPINTDIGHGRQYLAQK